MKAMNGIIPFGCDPKLVYATWNDKFPAEKVCFEDENWLIHFDGILLNSSALKTTLDCANNQEILLQLYKAHGAKLVFYAKGLYTLVIWDKQARKVLVTNDLLSKRSLYYRIGSQALCYASSYHDLLDVLSGADHIPHVDVDAVRDMVRQGFVGGSKTYLEQVRYLNAFESLLVDLQKGSAQLVRHEMPAVEIPGSEDAMIDKFQQLFSNAVALQFGKNEEYGYTQCATISGGMDSRSCLLTANKLGFNNNIVCFTYAQSGSLDYSISTQIATDLGLDYVFYPMDAAVFLGRQQEAMSMNECMQSGIGATGARTMASILDTSKFGLINIGICGGELMGDLVRRNRSGESKNKLLRIAGRICNKLKEGFGNPEFKAEDYCFDLAEYLCHLRASQNFPHMFIDKCECVSPFMDEDVVVYTLQLNPGLMYDRRFYRKWMCKYIPNSYIVTSSCTTVDAPMAKQLLAKLKYRVLTKRNGISQWEMNPINRWVETQPHHADRFLREYEDGCNLLSRSDGTDELLDVIQKGWWQSPWIKRLYVLTGLQALKDIDTHFQNFS